MTQRTTEDLRAMLFSAMERVDNGTMEPRAAKELSTLADRIIKTAEIELRYALVCSQLDRDEQGINPGPLLLTNKSKEGADE